TPAKLRDILIERSSRARGARREWRDATPRSGGCQAHPGAKSCTMTARGSDMSLRFGVFDHIEPVPGQRLDQIYRERLGQIDRLDRAGFYADPLAGHPPPALHRP